MNILKRLKKEVLIVGIATLILGIVDVSKIFLRNTCNPIAHIIPFVCIGIVLIISTTRYYQMKHKLHVR